MLLPDERKGECEGDWQPAYSGAFLEDDQKSGLLMSLDYDIAIMVGEMVAGNAYVSATRWQRVVTVSGPVLRSTPGDPHLPPCPLPLPRGERKGERGVRERQNSGNPSHNGRTGTVVAR